MNQAPTGKKREILASLAVLIVIVAIVAAVAVANKKPKATTDMTATKQVDTSSAASATATTDTTASSTYKDGNYSAAGSYESPGGQEQITVKLTLRGDVVTATSAISGATDPEARLYQSDFIAAYKQQVVGKKISSVSLSRVAGSSLTSQGFNDAIKQIENQAKA